MAPPPPSEPSSMGINTILRKNDGSVAETLETGSTAAFMMSSDLRGGHLFSPVECGIDLTLHETATPHDVIRSPKMKDPRPSTKTMTSYFVLDPPAINTTVGNPATSDRLPARAYTANQQKAETSESKMKTPALPINNLQKASTSESEMNTTTLLPPAMMHIYALVTPGLDTTKLPEEPTKHCQQVTTSHSDETTTISARRAKQHLNQAKIFKLQMMEHQLHTQHCWQRHLTPVIAPPQPPPSLIKKAPRPIADDTTSIPIIGFFPHYSHPPFQLSHKPFNSVSKILHEHALLTF